MTLDCMLATPLTYLFCSLIRCTQEQTKYYVKRYAANGHRVSLISEKILTRSLHANNIFSRMRFAVWMWINDIILLPPRRLWTKLYLYAPHTATRRLSNPRRSYPYAHKNSADSIFYVIKVMTHLNSNLYSVRSTWQINR